MHLHMARKGFVASTRRFIFAIFLLITGAVALGWAIDEFVAKVLNVAMRRSQRFALTEVPTFHQERYQYELLIVALIRLSITIIIFIFVYVFRATTKPTPTPFPDYNLRATSGPLYDPFQDFGQESELEPNPVTDPDDGIARIPTHGPRPRQESDVKAALEPNPLRLIITSTPYTDLSTYHTLYH